MVDIVEIESELGINTKAAIIEPIQHNILDEAGVQLNVKRDDLLHPVISGNKWRKLKFTLHHALNKRHQHLISMGGAYSNHLHALAYIGNKLNIQTTGLVRGEPPKNDNPTITDLKKWGMTLKFVSRGEFRELRKNREHNENLEKQYGGYWIPEGGATQYALKGINETLKENDIEFDTLALACGTGTTLAGLVKVLPSTKKVLGFSSLKGGGFLEKDIKKLLKKKLITNWSVNFDYHFGGFAKSNDELLGFMKEFQLQNQIPIEPIYNGKLLFGLLDLIKKGRFKKGHQIIAIHTGGLQGNRTVNNLQ